MRLLIGIYLCFLTIAIFSQDLKQNEEKYWIYRDRLNYFVVNGSPDEKGMCCIASERNAWSEGTIAYGQHMINFGYYLGVLATEYKIIENDTDKANIVRKELQNALKSYIRLDMCESLERWGSKEDKFDGFFMREDVPTDFAIKYDSLLNKKLTNSNKIDKSSKEIGMPAYVNQVNSNDINCPIYVTGRDKWNPKSNIVSQDEVVGLLMGLAIVKKCFPDSSMESEMTKTITHKLVTYMRNNEELYGKKHWRLYKPDGIMIDYNLGSDARAYSYGFAKSAEWITGNKLENYYSGFEKKRCYKFLWNSFQFAGVSNTHAHMIATLAAIGNSWTNFGKNRTGKAIKTVAKIEKWDPFYLLLWKFLQDSPDDYFLQDVINDLNTAPKYGPYCIDEQNMSNYGGWASSAKYWHTKKEQFQGTPGWFAGLYNGLDYMLLYNMYTLATKKAQ